MRFNPRTLRGLLPVFLTLLVLFEAAAYTVTTPGPRESFFELYALGANGLAGNYYPSNSTFIEPGTPVTWYIGISNQMGFLQFVDIRVKLGNQTINPPNDTTASPSPAPLIVEFRRFIPDNGTWEIPFVWQVLNFTTRNGYSRILQLKIDDITYSIQDSPTCTSLKSCRFRFIFELWTWSVSSADFQIGWWNGDQRRIAWLQLWFSLAPGAP